jgi:hypothetical protein
VKFIGTFGFAHEDPKTGKPLRGKYVVVEAETFDEAHRKMSSRFDRKWGCLYESKEEAGVDRFGLTNLDERPDEGVVVPNLKRVVEL